MSIAGTSRWTVAVGLVVLAAWSIGLAWLSGSFAYERDVLDAPVWTFVALQVAAGTVYLLTLLALRRRPTTRGLLMAVFAVGLIMRLAQFGAAPVLEDDFYRYLWDGAVTAHGHNPYTYSPEQVRQHAEGIPDDLRHLAGESGEVVDRVNHPWLRTIYPPTAQAAFTVGYWIRPFDIQGLRLVWLGLDLAVLCLLLALLRGSSSLSFTLAIYWLNPLLIKEVFNAGHMELVLVVALLAALLAVRRRWHKTGGLMLGLAAGAKVWPALWLPLLLRHGGTNWRRGIAVTIAFAIPAAVLAMPILMGRLDAGSGFTAYAQRWQMNDSAYLIVHELAKLLSPENAHRLARWTIAAVLLGLIVFCLRRFRSNFDGLVSGAAVITAALFLLSPTQFPWYFLWLLPLLTLRPIWSLLALTVTLPLYYLRFPLAAMGHAVWFDYGIVWIQFVPVWLLLAWELRRRSTTAPNHSSVHLAATSCDIRAEAQA